MAEQSGTARTEHLKLFIRTVPGAADVLTLFESKLVINKLVSAAAQGVPPITAVSQDLIELLGPKRARDPKLTKFVGRATRAVMEAHGFELAQRNVRVRSDPIFTVGSVYRKAGQSDRAVDKDISRNDLLYRFLDSLNQTELTQVSEYLRHRR